MKSIWKVIGSRRGDGSDLIVFIFKMFHAEIRVPEECYTTDACVCWGLLGSEPEIHWENEDYCKMSYGNEAVIE
jgi:hypothetical protein